ncbi:MAG: hypothetical protein SFW67_23555 [Myxococcaceae bacterium]|nr:hypothetical protein [Myxococcaceae bacterium]
MTCDDVQQRLVTGALAAGDEAHLAQCRSCQAVRAGHGGALGLRGVELSRPTRVRATAVLARAGLVMAALLAVVTVALRPGEHVEAPVAAQPPPVALDVDADEWAAFVAFTRGVERDVYRDVVTADPVVPSYGALSSWVAPGSTLTSLEN